MWWSPPWNATERKVRRRLWRRYCHSSGLYSTFQPPPSSVRLSSLKQIRLAHALAFRHGRVGAHKRVVGLHPFDDQPGQAVARRAALRLASVAGPGCLSARLRFAADADARMDWKLGLLYQAEEVNVLVAAKMARVLSEEREQSQKRLDRPPGKNGVIQFLRLGNRAEVGEKARV